MIELKNLEDKVINIAKEKYYEPIDIEDFKLIYLYLLKKDSVYELDVPIIKCITKLASKIIRNSDKDDIDILHKIFQFNMEGVNKIWGSRDEGLDIENSKILEAHMLGHASNTARILYSLTHNNKWLEFWFYGEYSALRVNIKNDKEHRSVLVGNAIASACKLYDVTNDAIWLDIGLGIEREYKELIAFIPNNLKSIFHTSLAFLYKGKYNLYSEWELDKGLNFATEFYNNLKISSNFVNVRYAESARTVFAELSTASRIMYEITGDNFFIMERLSSSSTAADFTEINNPNMYRNLEDITEAEMQMFSLTRSLNYCREAYETIIQAIDNAKINKPDEVHSLLAKAGDIALEVYNTTTSVTYLDNAIDNFKGAIKNFPQNRSDTGFIRAMERKIEEINTIKRYAA